ncbi:MAG: PAS domain S-box protein, partial [Kiritimatiellaeota bacterium]|nr:PAS domain S-box protein [Kiritimatiellota bacterium]
QSTPDGTLLSVNPAFATIHGYASPHDCIAAIHDAAHQFYVDSNRRQELRRRLDEQGEVREFENQVYRKDGSVIWVSTSARVIRNPAGEILYYEGFVSDISKRKQADESQARLATAVEQAAETIVITDPTGAIQYVNPAFERITGYTRAEAYGQNPRILQSGRHAASFYRAMWATLLAGHVWSGHFFNKRKDGTIYEEEATISPILDAMGKIINYVAVKRDVTREVVLEEQHRQAAKMEVVGQLAGGVAHDFNNKLQVIMGSVEMLLQDVTPGHPFHSDLLEIQMAAHRSAELTRQLLAFSRQQAIAPITLDVNAAISGSLKMLGRLIGENIHLRFVQHTDTGKIFMDPMQLDQILANLAVNARDAIAGTGHITIEVTARSLTEADCRDQTDFVPPGDYVALSFRDDGHGMTPEVQAHLFEPFFTTKGQGKGTGLGLAMVYGIVKQNHGAITVQSAPGAGATFSIYLPCSIEDVTATADKINDPLPTGTETVLVVEDEENILQLVQRTLAQLGYRVLTAAQPCLALERCAQCTGPLHLLLTDVIMPDLSGKELADQILQLRPDIRVLYMSGYPADIVAQHGHLTTNLHVLPKPFSITALAQHIRAALDEPPSPSP